MSLDRIQDRVQRIPEREQRQVAATTATKEDKKQDQEQGRHSRQQDRFGESSDFIQLITKDPHHYTRENLDPAFISKFTFKGVSTHRERAVVEVDIALSDGTLLQGAQIAVSREEGMKFLSRQVGEEIVIQQLVKGASTLSVALPQYDPEAFAAARKVAAELTIQDSNRSLVIYFYLAVMVLLAAAAILIYFLLI